MQFAKLPFNKCEKSHPNLFYFFKICALSWIEVSYFVNSTENALESFQFSHIEDGQDTYVVICAIISGIVSQILEQSL